MVSKFSKRLYEKFKRFSRIRTITCLILSFVLVLGGFAFPQDSFANDSQLSDVGLFLGTLEDYTSLGNLYVDTGKSNTSTTSNMFSDFFHIGWLMANPSFSSGKKLYFCYTLEQNLGNNIIIFPIPLDSQSTFNSMSAFTVNNVFYYWRGNKYSIYPNESYLTHGQHCSYLYCSDFNYPQWFTPNTVTPRRSYVIVIEVTLNKDLTLYETATSVIRAYADYPYYTCEGKVKGVSVQNISYSSYLCHFDLLRLISIESENLDSIIQNLATISNQLLNINNDTYSIHQKVTSLDNKATLTNNKLDTLHSDNTYLTGTVLPAIATKLKHLDDFIAPAAEFTAKENSSAVDQEFFNDFTGSGSSAASVSDVSNMSDVSGSIKSGLNGGGSVSNALSVFNNSNSIWEWFSQSNYNNINNPSLATREYIYDFYSENQFDLRNLIRSDER